MMLQARLLMLLCPYLQLLGKKMPQAPLQLAISAPKTVVCVTYVPSFTLAIFTPQHLNSPKSGLPQIWADGCL